MSPGYNHVKDSGERQKFSTGAQRDIQKGKGRFDLLPPIAIRRLAKHFENGAAKYGDENWKKGIPLRRYLDSGLRHAFQVLECKKDEDHVAAVIWNFCCFLWTAEQIEQGNLPKELDDLGYTDTTTSNVDRPRP